MGKGKTPIKCEVLRRLLDQYPNRQDAEYLKNGFENGFPLGYSGPREPFECKHLKSVNGHESIVRQKLLTEVEAVQLVALHSKHSPHFLNGLLK